MASPDEPNLHERRMDEELVLEAVGICHTCVHKRDVYTCDAFPDGIPVEILTGDAIHNRPYPGDRGIRYERMIRGV